MSWSAVNTARSALSVFLRLDGVPVGKHPDVIRLMKGLFNRRPPKPRYCEIWDVRIVLNKLRQWSPCKGLSLKQLSLKLVMLLSLVTAQRGQTLHLIKLENCERKNSKYVIRLVDPIKQTKPGVSLPVLELFSYPPDRRLDIVVVLDEYLRRTRSLRSSTTGKLLLAYVKPHKPIARATISRWIKSVLVLCNLTSFGAHSTRAASVTAAHLGSVSVQEIIEKAGWSNEKTFASYYKKPVSTGNQSRNYSEVILQT